MNGILGKQVEVSGEVVNGFRELPVNVNRVDTLAFKVYRGDYVKFKLSGTESARKAYTISIPDLKIADQLRSGSQNPFYKMKVPGTYAFQLGLAAGSIEVVPYQGQRYHEVQGKEAFELVYEKKAHLLDVRTEQEYLNGHIGNAQLVPLDQLQSRIDEIKDLRDAPVMVYCATGNRSTTASKILIDAGFNEIYNLKHGIVGWASSGYLVNF